MRLLRPLFLGVLAGLACGDEGPAAPVPSAMVATGGNLQAGLPGVTLALPLRVALTGAGGAAFRGARVTWAVTAGSASVGSPVDTSDAGGESSTTVTIGVVPGPITVMATATGVTPVNFTLAALDPCVVRVPLSADTTATGVLTNFDCAAYAGSAGPFFTDYYRFTVPGQVGLQISMNAVFDAYLEQFELTGPFIAYNDDVDSTLTNSRVLLIAGAGTYVLAASTFGGSVTGPYSLTIAPRAQTIAGCRGDNFLPWITRGVAIAEEVQATDCTTTRTGGGRAYGDRVLIVATPARPLAVTLASAAFNPRLEIWEVTETGSVFRTSNDGASGTVTLNHTPTAGGIFRLEITSVDTVQTGAYTLTVGGPVPSAVDVITLPLGQLQERRSGKPPRN